MELKATETVRATPSRHKKSLGLLTVKFVSLLQDTKDGALDLKAVSANGDVAGGFVSHRRGMNRCSSAGRSATKGCQSHARRSGALICGTGGSAGGHCPLGSITTIPERLTKKTCSLSECLASSFQLDC